MTSVVTAEVGKLGSWEVMKDEVLISTSYHLNLSTSFFN
jgi:hypothetical protein